MALTAMQLESRMTREQRRDYLKAKTRFQSQQTRLLTEHQKRWIATCVILEKVLDVNTFPAVEGR